ncbi:uncharacterized protein LOC144578806 [Callithrix jacchus]
MEAEEALYPGAPGAAPARAQSGPPASKLLRPPGTCPSSHLTCPVPAGPARASGSLPALRPTLPSRAFPARPSGPPAGSGGRCPPRSPRPSLGTHFLNPLQRHGSGMAVGTPAGGGRLRGSGARVVPGWALAARLAPRSGSPARRSQDRSGRRSLLRVRPRASVRAGTPARLFCFRFCFWEGACALPAAPRPAWHTGKCSSSPVLGRRPAGAGRSPTHR